MYYMTRTKCQQYKALWAAQLGAFYFLVEPTADRGSIETLHMQHYILGAEGLWCFQLWLYMLLWFEDKARAKAKSILSINFAFKLLCLEYTLHKGRPCTITQRVIVQWNRHRTIDFHLMCTLFSRTKTFFTLKSWKINK